MILLLLLGRRRKDFDRFLLVGLTQGNRTKAVGIGSGVVGYIMVHYGDGNHDVLGNGRTLTGVEVGV